MRGGGGERKVEGRTKVENHHKKEMAALMIIIMASTPVMALFYVYSPGEMELGV